MKISEDIQVEFTNIQDTLCLKFTFQGIFTAKQAESASEAWVKAFKSVPEKKIAIVFDCHEMTNYEPLARAIWQKTISSLKSQIASIWVISDSKLISAGAAIMGIFTSFSIKTVRSEDMITF